MVLGNGVKNIQAAAYNGARTVHKKFQKCLVYSSKCFLLSAEMFFKAKIPPQLPVHTTSNIFLSITRAVFKTTYLLQLVKVFEQKMAKEPQQNYPLRLKTTSFLPH